MISSLRSRPTSWSDESLTCREASASSREAARDGDRRVSVTGTVPQVHRRFDLAERERPRGPAQGELLHCATGPLPERVSDGLEFDPQADMFGLRVAASSWCRERSRRAGLASDHLITVSGTAFSAGAFLASQP